MDLGFVTSAEDLSSVSHKLPSVVPVLIIITRHAQLALLLLLEYKLLKRMQQQTSVTIIAILLVYPIKVLSLSGFQKFEALELECKSNGFSQCCGLTESNNVNLTCFSLSSNNKTMLIKMTSTTKVDDVT